MLVVVLKLIVNKGLRCLKKVHMSDSKIMRGKLNHLS